MGDLLKIVTCGSVDDGKSTVIGRLLYDAKLLFTDQRQTLILESEVKNNDGTIDYSLLLDGLAAEREQGITIDVAYRYFNTDKRNFIVADAPGHEEYTRNMAVAASFADIAIILVNANKGVMPQTKRHIHICKLMGISDFIIVINKMDLVNYKSSVFDEIKNELELLFSDDDSTYFIPTSATNGYNVVNKSNNMSWYKNDSLLELLEKVETHSCDSDYGFVFPVQRVSKLEDGGMYEGANRGFQGTVSSGKTSIGDEIIVYPSRTKSRIVRLLNKGKTARSICPGDAATIVLEDELDISRGCVISNNKNIKVSDSFIATLLWTDEDKLVEGKNFLIKIGTQTIPCVVDSIRHKLDITSNKFTQVEEINKNDICQCKIKLNMKIALEQFNTNKTLGSFILIDRLSNATSACGVIDEVNGTKSTNLTWQDTHITKEARENHMGQKGLTIWFTGLSGSGKSTIADELETRLYHNGYYTMLLDGDNVRMGLNNNLGFSEEDRSENIRRISEVSKLMNDAGLIVMTSFISPFEADRTHARNIIGDGNFIEVYISTPIEECERRDIKGLYKKARDGVIKNFTGVSSPYEEPTNPELSLDTSKLSVDECVDKIISFIENKTRLSSDE